MSNFIQIMRFFPILCFYVEIYHDIRKKINTECYKSGKSTNWK